MDSDKTNPESDNKNPENAATGAENAAVDGGSGSGGGSASPAGRGRGWIVWTSIGAVVIGGVAVCTMSTPGVFSSIAKGRMAASGFSDFSMQVDSAGPFFAKVHDLSFTAAGGAVKISGVEAMADYSPLSALGGGAFDDAIIENAHVDVDLKKLAESKGPDGFAVARLPFVLPSAMDSLPAKGFLVRGAEVNVISGGTKHTMKLDALARAVSKDNRSATISATGANGDQLLVTLQPKKGGSGETVNAEGSVDPLGWYIAVADVLGKNLPQEVGLEAAPLVVQFAADIEGGKPGKWVWVVSQPWFQINNGPVVVSSQDARAGFTGEGDKLVKASAEGDILLKAGNLTVGPFHASAKTSGGALQVEAVKVPIKGRECSMTLDYCRLAANPGAEQGDLSLAGVVKPAWMPVDLNATLTFSDNMDGLFLNMNLPRTVLKDAVLPTGWLPSYMDGMKISGGVDADFYLSVGGLSAGGFASSGRISSDNASFVIPTTGGEISFSGVRMRNARFSSSAKGFSVDIPDGFMATKVRFGNFEIGDFQLWPGRVSIPGDATLDSATANVFGGRLVVGRMQGRFSPAGVFVPSSPFEVRLTDADLAQVAQLAGGVKMSGRANISAHVSPVVDNGGNLMMGVKSSVESDDFTLEFPGAFSVAGKKLDADFEFDNLTDQNGTRARLALSDAVELSSFSACGAVYSGKAYVKGWAESSAADILAALVKGPFFSAKSDVSARMNGGELSLPGGMKVSGARGVVLARLGGDNPAVFSDGDLDADSVGLGALLVTKAEAAFRIVPDGFVLSDFGGQFLGGTMRVENFVREGAGYTCSIKMEGISAESLAALFPQFGGKVSGALDGGVTFHEENGVVTVRSGELHLRDGASGTFSYRDAAELLLRSRPAPGVMTTDLVNAAGGMTLTSFSIRIGGTDAPFVVRITGMAPNGAAVSADVLPKVDVAKQLEAVLGGAAQVRLAAAR
jgi:hypothetical protein